MTETCFDLPQGGFFCLSRCTLSRSTLNLIHRILSCFGHWNLRFICNLVLVIWDLTNFILGKSTIKSIRVL
jgi:hypothetical protein